MKLSFRLQALRAVDGRCVLEMLLLGCIGAGIPAAAQEVAPSPEDYRTARQHFQTRLTRHGPSPQKGETLSPPAGAQRVEYAPALHLQAWITPSVQGVAKKKPAVLFLHGRFALSTAYWKMAQPYRDAGYIVMMPALRGENGQQGEFSLFYDEVNDAVAAADYLAKLPQVDADRIYLVGHSVGGTMALLTAMVSTRFRAAASFSGAPDVKAWAKYQEEFVVFSTADPKEFQMRSPLAFAGSFQCPVRLYCGDEPHFIPATRLLSARARQHKRDVEAVQVHGNHFSAVPAAIQESLRFFHTH